MKIFDMHIHARKLPPEPQVMLEKMDKAGVWGGCVFSTRPIEFDKKNGMNFEKRLAELKGWCEGYEDRIFPILWIHPFEENIIEKIHKAVDEGVCGFKIICADFYIYEPACLEVLREIASLNKPVFFHTGILWDGKVSSAYNRPLNWEALLDIKGLRFSMGHCSWPWIDECVAMYGKFLNAYTKRDDAAEMFFDITPGTPEIYREELLTKLYTVGYDVGDNIMFGTDATANTYNSDWAKQWLDIDKKILDGLGVSEKYREKLYYKNLLRFLGKSEEIKEYKTPVPDEAQNWSAENKEVCGIIEKWYKKLGFPKEYDNEFYDALKTVKISDAIKFEDYDLNSTDGKRNLLSFLYFCQELEKKYENKGIDKEIFIDTVKDLVCWTVSWSNVKGELYLGELSWLKRHFEMRLFKLGRLQFCYGESEHDVADKGIKKGDNVMEVHIPAVGTLSDEECKKSFEMAKEFYKKHYPEYKWEYFTCHSWLMDKTLEKYLPAESNILKFRDMFEIVTEEKSDSILKYVFEWNTTRVNLKAFCTSNSFGEKIKKAALKGEAFYENLGVIKN